MTDERLEQLIDQAGRHLDAVPESLQLSGRVANLRRIHADLEAARTRSSDRRFVVATRVRNVTRTLAGLIVDDIVGGHVTADELRRIVHAWDDHPRVMRAVADRADAPDDARVAAALIG